MVVLFTFPLTSKEQFHFGYHIKLVLLTVTIHRHTNTFHIDDQMLYAQNTEELIKI